MEPSGQSLLENHCLRGRTFLYSDLPRRDYQPGRVHDNPLFNLSHPEGDKKIRLKILLGVPPHFHVLCTDGCFYGEEVFRVLPRFNPEIGARLEPDPGRLIP